MTASRHNLRHVLEESGFRRLMAVRMTGQLGDGLFQGALFSSAFFNPEKATTAGGASLIFAASLLPYSVVGPFAGVFLDRWRRQRVLLNANIGRSTVVVGLAPLLAAFGATSALCVVVALLI